MKNREPDSPSPKGAGWKGDSADLSAFRLVSFVVRIVYIVHHLTSTDFARRIIKVAPSP